VKKYIYLIGGFYSFVTFMIGFNHTVDHGPEIFNIGFMLMTPVISFLLASLFLRDSDEKKKRAVVK